MGMAAPRVPRLPIIRVYSSGAACATGLVGVVRFWTCEDDQAGAHGGRGHVDSAPIVFQHPCGIFRLRTTHAP